MVDASDAGYFAFSFFSFSFFSNEIYIININIYIKLAPTLGIDNTVIAIFKS